MQEAYLGMFFILKWFIERRDTNYKEWEKLIFLAQVVQRDLELKHLRGKESLG